MDDVHATTPPSLLRKVAIAVAGIAAIFLWMWSGLGVLVLMLVTPDPGQEAILRGLQVALVAGWIGTLLWLLHDLVAGTLRFLLAPIAAWAWTYGLSTLIGWVADLKMGY